MSVPSGTYWVDRPLEVTVEGESAVQLSLPQPYALIGSDKLCDVVLADSALPARCYFACVTHEGLLGATLAHPRSDVTRQFRRINADRGVRLGRKRLKFQTGDDNGIATPQLLAKKPKTHFIRWTDPQEGRPRKRFTRLSAGRVLLLGRTAPSAVLINDTSISSVHAAIYHDGESLWVVDLNSTNGTFINSKQVRCGRVAQGRSFRVGSTKIRFGRDTTQSVADQRSPSSTVVVKLPDVAAKSAHTDEIKVEHEIEHQKAIADLANRLAAAEAEARRVQSLLDSHESDRQELETLRKKLDLQSIELTQREQTADQRQIELERLELAHADRRNELAERKQQIEAEEEANRNTQAKRTADIEQAQAEFEQRVADQTAALAEERQKIERSYGQLSRDRSDLERCSIDVAEKLKRTKLDLKRLSGEIKRENELLVVNRIRTRRGLEDREAAVIAAEKEIERRKAALLALEQRVQRQQDEFSARQRRYVPPEEGLVRSPIEISEEPAPAADSLLESADFTELLRDFVSKRK